MGNISYMAKPPSRRDIEEYVARFANKGVDVVVFDLANADQCVYRSKVTETWPPRNGEGLGEPLKTMFRYPIRNVWHMIDSGIDLPAVLAAACHRNGLQFWAGIRLNTSNYRTRIKAEHPEWLLPIGPHIIPGCLDYEQPEVRAHVLDQAREFVAGYDADGLYLNFVRYQGMFHPDRAHKMGPLVAGWLGEIRSMLGQTTAKKGKAYLPLGVQVFSRIPDGLRFGQDYALWAKQGVVDYLCPGRENHMDFNLPVEQWMEVIQGTHCRLFPVLQPNLGYPMGTVDNEMTRDKFRAAVHNYYQGGAHGLSSMNLMDNNTLARELREPEQVAAGRHHYHFASPAFSSFDGNLNYKLEPNVERQDYRFRVWTDASRREPGSLRVTLASVHASDEIEIDLNRAPLPKVPAWNAEGTAAGARLVHPRTLVEGGNSGLAGYRYEVSLAGLPLRKGENSLGLRVVSRDPGASGAHPALRGIEVLL